MRGKLTLVAGVAIGYVLGSRAGRERYEQIAAASSKVWHSRPVQAQVHNVEAFVQAKTPVVLKLVRKGAKKATAKAKDVVSSNDSAPTTSSTATKPGIARKPTGPSKPTTPRSSTTQSPTAE